MQRDPDVPAGYYVPAPSRWPVIGAAALFLIGLGAALSVNALVPGYWTLAAGVAVLLWMLWGWFRDVIRESVRGSYARQEDQSFRWGMGWFIFSEIMFFGALFGALFYVRVIALPDLGGPGAPGSGTVSGRTGLPSPARATSGPTGRWRRGGCRPSIP